MFKICRREFSRFFSSYSKIKPATVTKPILYGDEASPPVRFVLMTASVLNIKLDYHEINLFNGQNKTDFYKKINPLQKVPVLDVQNQLIRDSHAICAYLCQQSDDKTLYPNEPFKKAKIDEMLFFNCGTLFPIDSAIFTDYFSGRWPADRAKLDMLNVALDHVELHLTKSSWLTGDEMRLCDICLMATITSVYLIVQRATRHRNIDKWLNQFQLMPFYDINRKGLERLLKFVRSSRCL